VRPEPSPSILVVGEFAFQFYEPDVCEGLRAEGARVTELRTRPLFGPVDLLRRAQEKLVWGPGPLLANLALVRRVRKQCPDAVLAWRTPWLRPWAIQAVQRLGAKVWLANNDDPFGPDRDKRIWKSFRRAIPFADVVCVFRDLNVPEALAAGARRVHVLRAWFHRERHRPLALTEAERARFGCDVIFVGHAEDDGRLEALEALMAAGLSVKVFGTGWGAVARGRPLAAHLPCVPLYGDDYVKALCAAKAALVFLSKRNRDDYTQRCFEIPACGTLMLAPRTARLTGWFREDQEALYQGSTEELVAQARRLVGDPALRERIAAAGRARVLAEGHDVQARARELLGLL
jgi:glycosyltransferase involved in cell wall biosynthesis